jgi:CRP/FNR family transcriptional regulator, polysaccharide utilization system transcription regulator
MSSSSSTRCSICRSRTEGFFCTLVGPARERLEREVVMHAYARGQVIAHAGTPAQALYVVRTGWVKVYRPWPSGEEQVLRLLGPGELIGYRPLLSNEPFFATLEAVEDSTVCIIPAGTVRDLLQESPGLAIEFLAKLARELRISEELMMDLIRRPVLQRTARLLLHLLPDTREFPGSPTVLTSGMKRKDMARMIGTSPETFSRTLRSLALRGAVSLSRTTLRVSNRPLLRRVAGESELG